VPAPLGASLGLAEVGVVALEDLGVAQAVGVGSERDDDGKDRRIRVRDDGAFAGTGDRDLVESRDAWTLRAHEALLVGALYGRFSRDQPSRFGMYQYGDRSER
jgi:hypothetical protein